MKFSCCLFIFLYLRYLERQLVRRIMQISPIFITIFMFETPFLRVYIKVTAGECLFQYICECVSFKTIELLLYAYKGIFWCKAISLKCCKIINDTHLYTNFCGKHLFIQDTRGCSTNNKSSKQTKYLYLQKIIIKNKKTT